MLKNRFFLLLLFCIIGLLNIIGEQTEMDTFVIFTKPILAPILLIHFYHNYPFGRIKNIIISALAAAWLGDIVLLMHDQKIGDLFLVGIGCFAVTQILLTLGFYKIRKGKFFQTKLSILLISIFWVGFNIFINDLIDTPLVVPILIYSFLISLMLLQAFYLFRSDKKYVIILIGAGFFYISDLAIAMSKFAGLGFGLMKSGTVIMATYILALLLIVKGLTEK